MGFTLIPVVRAMGAGFELANWYRQKHSMQNAADAATIAAIINGSASYDIEAKAVAAQYCFVDGSNNATVTGSNTATCPAGGNTCNSVTISSFVPLYLSPVLGYKDNATALSEGLRENEWGA
jgi:Flp pilus assembly protein TadG